MIDHYPNLIREWDYEKNKDIDICSIPCHARGKVWWRCEKGHEWLACVYSRTNKKRNAGCPYCSNKRVLAGYNDLATKRPDIAAEWHPTRNGNLTPQDVTVQSNKKVWWKCEKGHEWQACVSHRTNKDRARGCPYCSNKRVLAGYNDLATKRPDIAAEWHPTLNDNLTPQDVTVQSNKKVWWKCKKGHEWQTYVYSRTKKKRNAGCPYCSRRRPVRGENDIATLYPEIAAEWHPTRNGDKKPEDYSRGSTVLVWWQCEKGHEWPMKIRDRCIQNYGCPYCSGRRKIE